MSDAYDVAILGGGLAGLTLARQIKLTRPDTSIVVLEKREGPAPDAAFKVGESTTEVGARYFAHIIGMKDHLDEEQIHKFGLRFFLSDGKNDDIARRIEMGIPFIPPDPSFQIDRGRFENELARRNADDGVEIRGGSRVGEVETGSGDAEHVVHFEQGGEQQEVRARWVVDAAGRTNILKKTLGLEKDNAHNINSAWWRLDGGIVIDEWSDEQGWIDRMPEEFRGKRMQSTNHLMGEGYWIWMIPLKSGPISVGICCDPRIHPWENFQTYEKCQEWLREHEPQLAAAHEGRDDQVLDFLKIEGFSHSVERAFSPDRWAVTGDAGAFVDPLFSPGSNYIAFSNSFIHDLIVHDLDGDDISERAEAHNDLYLHMYEIEVHPYVDFYLQMGNPQVTVNRITWGTIAYWSLTGVLYFNDNKLTDPEFMADVRPHMERGWELVRVMNDFLREWHDLDKTIYRNAMVNMVDPQVDAVLYLGLFAEHDDDSLKKQIETNVELMESIAVALFHKGIELLQDAEIPSDKKVNPYALSMKPERWESDGLFDGSGWSLEEVAEKATGLDATYLDQAAEPVGSASG
jgi:flavin-dependent dehydrogenase